MEAYDAEFTAFAAGSVRVTTIGAAYADRLVFTTGTSGAAHKAIVAGNAAWYSGATHLTDPAATLEVRVGDRVAQFPVRDGDVAAVLKVPTRSGLQPVRWRVLDVAGRVLRSGADG